MRPRLLVAAVMCAVAGCATPPSARDAADRRGSHETDPQAPSEASQRASASSLHSGFAGAALDGRGARALPWLSARHVGAAVRAHRDDFQACHALSDVLSRREDGSVTVGWAVRADGSVHQVTLGRSTFREASINDCVLDVARQVRFPASAAPSNVSWTVQFRGAPHGPLADATAR